MEPRPPNPSNPSTPPLALPVSEEAGETASGPHTAASSSPSNVIPFPTREPQAGDIIGPYRIVGELGRGGMAVVYLAEEDELSRQVALKVLLPATTVADPHAKARFVREGRAQAKITHDHVVAIYRVGEAGGVSYIAMPVLKGQTLSAAIHAKGRMSATEVVRIGGEIAEGLAAAHAVGLVHRDIKPGNIWLEAPKKWVKLLDFGLARDPEGGDPQITISGKVVGTPAYMSPEQAAGHPVDHRTDLFSLGVVLYQMATGRKPFIGENSLNTMAAILTEDPPPPGDLVPDLPPSLAALIQRLLTKDPGGRPQTAAQVVAEMEAIRRALAAPPPVVVVSLPAVPAAAAPAADPWANLETTEKEETPAPAPRPAAKSSTRNPRPERADEDQEEQDEQPRRRAAKRDEPAPRSLKWAWIAGGVVGVLLVGGLVWLAVAAVLPKPKPEVADKKDKEPPKPPPQPKPKDKEVQTPLENDRAAAETLIPKARLKLLLDGGPQELEVAAGGVLPTGKITVTEIDFEDSKTLSPVYTSNTFLPAVATLKSLTQVRMKRWQMEFSAAQVGLLAAMPLASTIQRLDSPLELTPASLAEVKKFTTLDDAAFLIPDPNDALFERMAADLSRLKVLTFLDMPASVELTSKGWEAVAKMPRLVAYSMVRCETAGDAFRVFTTRGVTARLGSPGMEFQGGGGISDEALLSLSRRPTDVKILSFHRGEFTDKGLGHLAEVKSLKTLILSETRVTGEAVKALIAARPDMKITWDEKTIEPKKKP